ncbi:MAG TPA: protein kinase [Polyangiales bacterium]|nr:protein kinase [Polyangiales bacterium]
MDDRPSSIPGPGALIDNKYKVEELIARGGMGVVYAAKNVVTGKRVALKWMLPALGQIKGARERFMQEASATARIAHPNIVDIYDVGSEHGSAYLVMEYLRGETLADRMCRLRLPVVDAIALLMPALRGVAAAHRHGVIHRDLKPENIFLCCTEHGDELEPKVLDFGISKITTDEVRNLALTHSGAVLGTPYYMSPEQVRGSRDVDHRADVYALGVILFEALTGERPFDAETYNELILKIATEPLPSIAAINPDLDPRLIAIVERAMARDPKDRFPDVKTLALALEPFAGGVRFRSMQTLHPHEKNSGDFPIGMLDLTRPGQATPAAEPVASSAPPVSYDVVSPQPQRGTRMAIAATFFSLLACAGVAVYFLNHPELPPLQPEAPASEVPAAVSSSAPTPEIQPPVIAPSIPVPTIEIELPAVPTPAPVPSAAPSGDNSAPVELAAPSPRGPSPSRASSTLSKRSTRAPKPTLEPPPEPAPAAPAPVVVRALPNDWDRRLDQPAAPAANVHIPAGHININDFR